MTVLEAEDEIGGGTRSGELTVRASCTTTARPCTRWRSARPFLNSLGLERHGLEWRWPEVDLAHPLDDGSAGVMFRSVDETARGLGDDGARGGGCSARRPLASTRSTEDLFRPFLHLPQPSDPAAASGWRRRCRRPCWRGPGRRPRPGALRRRRRARVQPLDRPMSSAVGMALICACHRFGWAVARGGSGSITDALAASCASTAAGSRPAPASSPWRAADADAVVLDLAPRAVADLAGGRLPARVARAYRRYRHGPGAFKVDLAVEGASLDERGLPARGHRPRGGPFEEIVAAERDVNRGRMPERPFVLVSQQYLADPSAPRETSIRSGHTPTSRTATTGTPTEALIDQIERFAPGLRERIVGHAVRSTAEIEAGNANYVGGDIITGANTPVQVLIRPRLALDPYSTGIPGVFICSAATPPGAGATE